MKKILLFNAILFVSSLLSAPFVYITHGETADVVTVVDLATNEIIATISVGSIPASVVVTPTATKAYVTNSSDSTVSVIDIATNMVIATIPVGGGPFGLAVTHDGTTVYVANSDGTVTPIDVATDTAGAPIVGFVGGARDITISPDDRTAYVSNAIADTVTPVDLTTGTLGVPIPVGDFPSRLKITPNGKKVYVLNAGTPNSVSVIDTAINTVIATILLSAEPVDLEISFDSRLVYFSANNGQIFIINISTDTIVNSVGPTDAPAGLAFFPSGQVLYIANQSGTLTPLNVITNTLGTPFAAGPGPSDIAITPIISVQGKLIKNIFLNKIELVVQLCWNICPFTLAAFFRIFQNGVVVGQVLPTDSPSKFVVCVSPNFLCGSLSEQAANARIEFGLFSANGVEIERIPVLQ